jgi:multidrug efflux pump subunit AcrB
MSKLRANSPNRILNIGYFCAIIFHLTYRNKYMKNNTIITKFSSFFIKKTRVTFLAFLLILTLGAVAYMSWLPREGFPEINIPYALVRSTYLVNDSEKVDVNVTQPIEKALQTIEEIKTINSDTGPVYSIVQVEFEEVVTSEEGVELINDALSNLNLPEDAITQASAIDGTKIEGEYDMMISVIIDEETPQTLLTNLTKELDTSDSVISAKFIPTTTMQMNPVLMQQVEITSNFHRIGLKDGDNLEFQKAYAIGLIKDDSLDAVGFSDSIRSEVKEILKSDAYKNVEVYYTFDVADAVNSQIDSLENNFLMGMIAVVFVLFTFINWRASLITVIFIPTVMAATFVTLYLLGYTLNVISLFSLILVLGLFVDDAIVVIEAIDYKKSLGLKGIEAIKSAIKEIGSADVTGTITTMLVFAPMLYTSGVLGKFISGIPITVIVALTISLVVALSIVPFFSNLIIIDKKGVKKTKKSKFNAFELVADQIGKFVAWYLATPLKTWIVIVTSFILIGVGGYFATLVPFSVFPEPKDTNDISVTISFTQSTGIDTAELITKDIEEILKDEIGKQIESVSYSSYTQDPAKYINLSVKLTDFGDRDITSQELIDNVNNKLVNYELASVKVGQVNAGPPSEEYPFMMQVYGDDLDVSMMAALEAQGFLDGLTYEDDELGGVTEVMIDKTFGISKKSGKRYIEVKAKLETEQSTAMLNQIRDDLNQILDEEYLEELELKEDSITYDFGFESQNMDSFSSLTTGFIITLVLMYVVLVLQYNSYLQPLLVFMAIPLSFPLLFPGLYLTNNALSFFSMLGIMGLVGIVVNNTIILVDFINQYKNETKDINTAIVNSVKIRLRPILTTSTTTLVGLIPLALADPFWEGLAFTIIFGLISSSTLVLLVFPAYYKVVESFRMRAHKVFKIKG